MFRFKNIIFLCFILLKSTVLAADIESLRKLFVNNFNHYYQPRYCGKNIKRLLSEAQKRNIDLSNSYILKVVGDGFFETSGFYTRAKPNQRAMLGYFHMILVADNMVFDFDLHAPLVLDVRNYIRLQFMPPYEPYIIYNVNYTAGGQPMNWDATRFDLDDYSRGIETIVWEKELGEYLKTIPHIKLDKPCNHFWYPRQLNLFD